MDALPLHPKLIHLPIALAVLMPMISVGLLLAWVRDLLPHRVWVVAVALQALLVVSGVVAMESGEDEEKRVEKIVPKAAIEAHAQAAEAFVWTAGGVLLLFVAGAALPSAIATKAAAAATAGTLVVLFLGYRAGEAGGHLVYEHGAAQAYITGASAGAAAPPGATK